MHPHQNKMKYKQIIEEPDSDPSDQDQLVLAYAHMTKQRKKHIRAHTSSHSQNVFHIYTDNQMLGLKQQLAQSRLYCKEQTAIGQKLKLQNQEQLKRINQLEYSIADLKKEVQGSQQKSLASNTLINQLQISNKEKDRQIQRFTNELDLVKKNLQAHIQRQIQVNKEAERNQVFMQGFQKHKKTIEKTKAENDLLKGDLGRVYLLIQESMRFGKISQQLMKRHFLGKPYKQLDYWYSGQLIGEVNHFLKKNGVGYGNKQFTAKLVKFIDRYANNVSHNKQNIVKQKDYTNYCKISKGHQRVNSSINKKTGWEEQDIKIKAHTSCSFWTDKEQSKARKSNTMGTKRLKN